MRYIYVRWNHCHSDEPVDLYIEIDEQASEVRKVEIFRDCQAGCASLYHSSNSTKLSLETIPSLEEIASNPEFEPKNISQEEFEKVWTSLCE
jgi:hypothetical protein